MLPNLQPEVFFPRRVRGASPVSHYRFALSVVAENTSPSGGVCTGVHVCRALPVRNKPKRGAMGADLEVLSPKRWPGGEDEVAPVGSNCGFLSFLERPKGEFGMTCQG